MPASKPSQDNLTVAERISEETGESVNKYSAEEYPLPDFDDLEFFDADEYYGNE